ncbi:Spy/CpxP family protein refolding chaperone [Brachyspira aalborgi]|uniref:Periplasmic heavy metal sensor n=1 Tax=Brachyspira aalborgi TaxID=29522 RepID=A0A5C8EQ68_9SPIR|nr:Spy/CpxP family protein refolding chaperone [Brachyspira aalborgi]TXJ39121.1 hypothetical protein EPJ81_08395 [Brachyspira aalborgi]
MFKKFLTTIILSMLVVSSVFAQPPTPPSENGYAPMPPTHRHGRQHHRHIHGIRGLEWINLTEEQINEINKIDYDYENKIREAEYRKRGIDYEFEFEREKADIDLKTIKDLINQRKDIEKEIDYLRIEKEVSIFNVLTAEQKEQINRIRYYR